MSLKTINKISLKKFTNIALFERREKNLSEIKNKKRLFPIKLNKNKNKEKSNITEDDRINLDYNQILFSFYSFQTEGNTEGNKTCDNFSNKLKKNITTKSIFNKTSNNFKDTSFPFYITQIDNNYNFTKIKNENNLNNRTNGNANTNTNTNNKSKKIKINKIKIKDNYDDLIFNKNYKTYTSFKYNKYKDKKDEMNKKEFLMNLKLNKLKGVFKDNYFNAKQFIDKTRKFLLIKYSSSVKNERKKRNEELIDNKIEMVDDKIRSLQDLKSLNNQYFNYKLSEYVKYIFQKREEERKFDAKLLNHIYSLKKEISRLMNKIKKIEFEKYNIMQWLFFQIKVKEKKLNLPAHYSKIIEASTKRNNTIRRTGQADIRFINHPTKKNKSTFDKNKLSNKEQNNDNNINTEEYSRILRYKKSLIFESPDDFLDEIKSIENKNIKLFVQGDILHSEIKRLKEKYSNLVNEKLNFDTDIFDRIKEKEMELEENKRRYKLNTKLITDYKNDRYNIKINKNKKNNTEINTNANDDYLEEVELKSNPKKLKLYTSVERLFSTCQKIEIKRNKEIFSLENQQFFIKKGNRTKEEEILQMMEFIEVRICHLLNIFSIYKDPFNPNYELIRRLRNNLMRKRKIEKANLARIDKEINYMKLIKEVEDKNNKLLFLQKRKMDMHNYAAWDNVQKKEKTSKKKIIYIPTFEDFLFDNKDEKFSLTIDNKNSNEHKNHFRAKS